MWQGGFDGGDDDQSDDLGADDALCVVVALDSRQGRIWRNLRPVLDGPR